MRSRWQRSCKELARRPLVLRGARARGATVRSGRSELLEEYDALVCPTAGTRGLLADDDYVGHGHEVDGRQLDFYFDGILTPVFNIMSRCPVLAVPSGFADNGVPTGVQIAGRTYDDETVFRLGAGLERERPWLDTDERRPTVVAAGRA